MFYYILNINFVIKTYLKQLKKSVLTNDFKKFIDLQFAESQFLRFSNRRVFLDGLIRAGTGPSIEASIQLLKSKELGPIEQKLVFLSLSNVRQASNDALKAAAVS